MPTTGSSPSHRRTHETVGTGSTVRPNASPEAIHCRYSSAVMHEPRREYSFALIVFRACTISACQRTYAHAAPINTRPTSSDRSLNWNRWRRGLTGSTVVELAGMPDIVSLSGEHVFAPLPDVWFAPIHSLLENRLLGLNVSFRKQRHLARCRTASRFWHNDGWAKSFFHVWGLCGMPFASSGYSRFRRCCQRHPRWAVKIAFGRVGKFLLLLLESVAAGAAAIFFSVVSGMVVAIRPPGMQFQNIVYEWLFVTFASAVLGAISKPPSTVLFAFGAAAGGFAISIYASDQMLDWSAAAVDYVPAVVVGVLFFGITAVIAGHTRRLLVVE